MVYKLHWYRSLRILSHVLTTATDEPDFRPSTVRRLEILGRPGRGGLIFIFKNYFKNEIIDPEQFRDVARTLVAKVCGAFWTGAS